MSNEELEKLINNDIPTELHGMPDVNSILEKCKSQKNKYNRTFKRLTIAFSCLIVAIMSVFLLTGGFNKQPVVSEKVEIVKIDQSDFMDSGIGCTPHIGAYGILIRIYYDYTKHPKYTEWTLGLENGEAEMIPYRPYEHNVNKFYAQKIYEFDQIDELFPNNVRSRPSGIGGVVITVSYDARSNPNSIEEETLESALDNMREYVDKFYETRDYKNLLRYSTKEYIIEIKVIECWPEYSCDLMTNNH